MRTEVVTDPGGLERLEPAWWDLFGRVPDATPFASPAWLLPWWRVFAPGLLRVVTLFEGDRLLGLAPLYLEDGAWGRRLLPIGIGITDMLDVVVDPAHHAAFARALQVLDRDVACWSAEEAPPGAQVLHLPDPPGWRSHVGPQSPCPTLALVPGRALSEVVPARKLRKWRMAQSRTARRVWSIDPADAGSLDSDLDALAHLHGLRWESRGEPGVLVDPAVRRFHRAAAPALLAAGFLRLSTLRIDGMIAGVQYALQRADTAYAYLGGFDPAFAFESPGTVLLGDAIAQASAAGLRAFTFLRGSEGYKYEWGAVDRWNSRRSFEPIR